MRRTRSPLVVVVLGTLAMATPALPEGSIVGGKAINTFTVPFSGTINDGSEDIALTGNVLVKTLHRPGFPGNQIQTSYKIDKTATGVGQTSGQTYKIKGAQKFKYILPGLSYPTQITHETPLMRLAPENPVQPADPIAPSDPMKVVLHYDTNGLITSAEATIEPTPGLGSCTPVQEVCN